MLVNKDDGGGGWKINKAFDSGSDLGFSATFHPSGVTFGVAFQDGKARLYDIRNINKPLTEIKSSRPIELMGAFRCMKFSDGPEDLLFISEQMSRVHIIDLRNFDNHQILTIPSRFGEDSSTLTLTNDVYDNDNNTTTTTNNNSISQFSPLIQSYDQVTWNNHHHHRLLILLILLALAAQPIIFQLLQHLHR